MNPIRICPKCGGPTRYYHAVGISRVVCKGTCTDWTVIAEFKHNEKMKNSSFKKTKTTKEKNNV